MPDTDNRNDLPPQLPVRACPWCQQLPVLRVFHQHGIELRAPAAGYVPVGEAILPFRVVPGNPPCDEEPPF